MFNVFWGNLSKNQKVILLCGLQILVIIILVIVVQASLGDKQHAEIEDTSYSNDFDIPSNAKRYVSENVWQVVQEGVADLTDNNVDDIVIREGSYTETENDDGSIGANFIVDIDSLKQTFVISTGWSEDGGIVYEVVIDCPPQNEMKYPETVCYGMYNNTYSLDLYLPHEISVGEGDNEIVEAYIDGSEYTHTIDVDMAPCDVNLTKAKVEEYLRSTPIKLNEYQINYVVNTSDIDCT